MNIASVQLKLLWVLATKCVIWELPETKKEFPKSKPLQQISSDWLVSHGGIVVQSMSSGTFTAPYKLIKCNETGGTAVQLPDGNVYAIQQIMAMFLGKMKEIAEGRFQN